MAETRTGQCRAKNPATCRYHATGVLIEAYQRDVLPSLEPYRQEAGEKALEVYAENSEQVADAMEKIVDGMKACVDRIRRKKGQQRDQLLAGGIFNDYESYQDRQTAYTGRSELQKIFRYSPNLVEYLYWETKFNFNRTLPLPETPNLLEKPETWKEEGYRYLLARMILEDGSMVDQDQDNTYGWHVATTQPLYQHVKKCGIGMIVSAEEVEWSEWGGTFNDDTQHSGIEGKYVCNCGGVRGKLRWQGTVSEAIQKALCYLD